MRGYSVIVPIFEAEIPLALTRAWMKIGLEALVKQNIVYLTTFPDTPKLYDAGIVYEREPPGQEEWQTIPSLLKTKAGDCEDLAAYRVAELCMSGEKARIITRTQEQMTGKKIVHVLVMREGGAIEDPSLVLGMGTYA